MQSDVEELKEFTKDITWFYNQYKQLLKTHRDEYIAVKNMKIIASGKNVKEVMIKVEKKGIDPSMTLIELVNENLSKMII